MFSGYAPSRTPGAEEEEEEEGGTTRSSWWLTGATGAPRSRPTIVRVSTTSQGGWVCEGGATRCETTICPAARVSLPRRQRRRRTSSSGGRPTDTALGGIRGTRVGQAPRRPRRPPEHRGED